MNLRTLLAIVLVLFVVSGVFAQEENAKPLVPGKPQIVEVEAQDGLTLVGDFYTAFPGVPLPTVLLLHQLYAKRQSWAPLIEPLVATGYNVVTVDLRGHGQTGGGVNWEMAVEDVQTWIDWLRTRPDVRPDAISLVGSSMGSSLAIVGCAHDPYCKTVIGLSPGLNYYGIYTGDALADGLSGRSTLLIYAERDYYSKKGVPKMLELAVGDVEVEMYAGNEHGMDLFKWHKDELIPLIVNWLNTH